MRKNWWAIGLGLCGALGCSGKVDLGDANPEGPTNVVGSKLRSFAAMPWGMCGVFENSQTYCWGWEGSTRAKRVAHLDGVAVDALTANAQICVAHADGSVGCTPDYETPVQSQLGVSNAVEVSVGYGQACSLRNDGTIQRWFTGEGCAAEADPRPIELPSPAVQVKCEDRRGCAVTQDGRLFCFELQLDQVGASCATAFAEVPGVNDATSVSFTMEQYCVLHADGTVSCAETDPVRKTDFEALTVVPGLAGIVDLRSSRIATCGLAQSGTLLCWGLSECGALGVSENCGFTPITAPIPVQADIETRLFGMQDGLTCSLDASDDVWCWGLSGWQGEAQGSPIPRRIVF